MNDQNPVTPPQSQQAPSVPVSPTPVTPAAPVTPQPTTSGTPPPVVVAPAETGKKTPPIDPKEIISKIKGMPLKFKLLGGLFLFSLMLVIIMAFTTPGKKVVSTILPTPSPIPTSTPIGEVKIPSPYATDPEVVDLDTSLEEFDVKLRSTDLKEDTLRIPNLDWDVNFKTK